MTHALYSPSLDHPAYNQAVKLRSYNCRVTVQQAVCDTDGARVLRRLNPAWTQDDHLALSAAHAAEGERLDNLHTQLLDRAHQERFGCSRKFEDYRIAAIGCEDYSEEMKAQLRTAAYSATNHRRAGRAHKAAARRR